MSTSKEIINGVAFISAQTGVKLTEEQKEVVYHFNDSMSVFANPGTGKTTTAVIGLIAAQTLHRIQGKKINAMSFTKLATEEISIRYKNACKKNNIVANVRFNTFHSICYKIIKKVYPDFTIKNVTNIESELKDFQQFIKAEGVERYEDMYFVRSIYRAMNSLNNELLFSKASVSNSSKFMDIEDGITLPQFQKIRARWFKRNFISQSIVQGDIPLMVLYVLLVYPEVSKSMKEEYELMVVDEFQDMSVLYLEILSLISNKLIVIGDLKQQIYGFNGASLLILDAYKEMYPDANFLELTQSFRCSERIVEFANKVIAPNEIQGFDNFKGTEEEGSVITLSNADFSFDELMDTIKEEQDNKRYIDRMFLARNNASVVPIIEMLYKRGIVFRTTKFAKVMDIPIFKDLCFMAEIALNDDNKDYVCKINKFFPEFKGLSPKENPILEVMSISSRESDKRLLTMNYTFSMDSSYVIINKLRRFKDLDREGNPFSVSCVPLLDIYEEFIIDGKWWKLERDREYYFDLVASIIDYKTYEEMVYDENEKMRLNLYYNSVNEGVRCYTFHSSKGLESDYVYMLDVDEGIAPKDKSVTDLLKKGCVLEAAKEVRNERNLLYVAITRCKRYLTIMHHEFPSLLISEPSDNKYSYLDGIWKDKVVLSNETKSFKLLLGVK